MCSGLRLGLRSQHKASSRVKATLYTAGLQAEAQAAAMAAELIREEEEVMPGTQF